MASELDEAVAVLRHRAEALAVTNERLQRELADLSRQAERVRQFPCRDDLTGLPNRLLLLDRLQQAMRLTVRQRGRLALVLLELDRLDALASGLGQPVVDRLLRHVARVLSSVVRSSDTVCRYGGAEFVLLLPAVDGRSGAGAVVRKVRERLSHSFVVGGAALPISVSAGLALYPGDGRDCVALLNQADVVLDGDRTRRTLPSAVPPREPQGT